MLKQRTILCITWAPGSDESESAIRTRNRYARDRLSTDCVKIFLDGVPTDSHTAAMLEPYVGALEGRQDEAARQWACSLVKQDTLDAAVTRFDNMGLTVKFHAAGDAAVRAGLNAIAAARKVNGFSAQMHNVGHCTFVAKSDVARARAIGATFEVSPYLWAPSPTSDDITTAVGNEVVKRVWPVRELIDSGALVVPGPTGPSFLPSIHGPPSNPWSRASCPAAAVNPSARPSPSRFPKRSICSPSTRQNRRVLTNKVGRIEAGMLADVIVLDQNPYRVPTTRIHDTKVKMTFIGGEKVFDASKRAN